MAVRRRAQPAPVDIRRATEPARPRSGSATSRSPTRPAAGRCSTASTSPSRPGASLAIVGQNGAGKTTIAKLLCRLYDPDSGSIEIDGVDLRDLDLDAWRAQLAAVFQDFVRYELTAARQRRTRSAATTDVVEAALEQAGALDLADLDTPMAKGYPGGVDLSGGQWQRVALARALAEVGAGADVVLLDEPTAMLDVRGESEIFRRVLGATSEATTILVSHRFSTVRQADLICVVEHGRAIELGSHDELVRARAAATTRCTTSRPAVSTTSGVDEHGEEVVHESL